MIISMLLGILMSLAIAVANVEFMSTGWIALVVASALVYWAGMQQGKWRERGGI